MAFVTRSDIYGTFPPGDARDLLLMRFWLTQGMHRRRTGQTGPPRGPHDARHAPLRR